jgi:hypothetical protein
MMVDVKKHPRMAQRTVAAIASDSAVMDLDGLGGHGQDRRLGHFVSWDQFAIA